MVDPYICVIKIKKITHLHIIYAVHCFNKHSSILTFIYVVILHVCHVVCECVCYVNH